MRISGWSSDVCSSDLLVVDAGWENAVEAALGQLIEGVLVEAPEALVEALGELGEGRLTLVAPGGDDGQYASSSRAAKVKGPRPEEQSVGKRGSIGVELGGRRNFKIKNTNNHTY